MVEAGVLEDASSPQSIEITSVSLEEKKVQGLNKGPPPSLPVGCFLLLIRLNYISSSETQLPADKNSGEREGWLYPADSSFLQYVYNVRQ